MPPRATPALQVLVAVPSPAVARRIADALLDARLCACAQTVGPITSRYVWRNKRETSREWLLLLKTRAGHFAALARVVRRLHPYEVPEIVGMPLRPVHPAYARWLRESTAPSAAGRPRPKA